MSGTSVIAGLGGLSTSILGVGTSMMTALIPALIAAAPIIIGIGIALAALYVLNELGVFDWIIEQGAAFGEWIRAFDIGAAFQGIIDFFTGLPEMIMSALGGGGGDIAGLIVSILFPPLLILNLLNTFFPEIGEWFADIGNKVLSFITSIDPVNIILGIVGAIFPPAKILAEMGVGLDDVIKFFTDLPGKIIGVISGIGPDTIVAGLLAVIFPPTLILTALGVSWVDVGNWFAELPGKILEALTGAAIAVDEFVNSIFPLDEIFNVLQTGWGDILSGVTDFVGSFVDAIVSFTKETLDLFADLFSGINQFVEDAKTAVLTFLTDIVTNTVQSIADILSAVTGFYSEALSAFTVWVGELTASLVTFFSDMLTALAEFATGFIAAFVSFFTDSLSLLSDWVTEFIDTTIQFFTDIITALTDWITEFTQTVSDFFADILTQLADWIIGFTESITDFFTDILTQFTTWVSNMLQGFLNFFAAVLTALADWITGFTESIVAFFADILAKLAEWAAGLVAGFVQCFTDIAAGIVAPLQTIYDTIYNKLTAVWNFVKGIWDNIVKAFNDIMSKIPLIGAGSSSSIPGYATGTDYVPETGIYLLHEGEAVIPAAQNNGSVGTGGSTTINNFDSIVLPNVTNYDEFRDALARDMRTSRTYRGV